MKSLAVIWDIVSLLNILINAGGLDEGRRILEGITDYLRCRIEDIEGAFFSASTQQGKKRKRDDNIFHWVTKGRVLVQEASSFLGKISEECSEKKREVGGGKFFSLQTCAHLVAVHKLINSLLAHEKEAANGLLSCALSDEQGFDHSNLIPVRELFGQLASDALEQLQALLGDHKIGRIAILGTEGIGKSFVMKHLHNCVLNWADEPERQFVNVFWVTTPDTFSIKRVQDVVAAAVNCDLHSSDDINVRAGKLSEWLKGLGNFVLFLDNVPAVDFSLDQIGIPVPAEGSKSKLVITTRSAVVSTMMECLGIVKLDRLSDKEACQMLMNEAGISMECASLLTSISSLLAKECHGVPRMVLDIATRMRGINDLSEWKNALYEVRNLGKRAKLQFQAIVEEIEV